MFNLFFALFMAFACPAHHTATNSHNTTVTTQGDHNPGDGGHIPPDGPN